jgi:hypothetical protein
VVKVVGYLPTRYLYGPGASADVVLSFFIEDGAEAVVQLVDRGVLRAVHFEEFSEEAHGFPSGVVA